MLDTKNPLHVFCAIHRFYAQNPHHVQPLHKPVSCFEDWFCITANVNLEGASGGNCFGDEPEHYTEYDFYNNQLVGDLKFQIQFLVSAITDEQLTVTNKMVCDYFPVSKFFLNSGYPYHEEEKVEFYGNWDFVRTYYIPVKDLIEFLSHVGATIDAAKVVELYALAEETYKVYNQRYLR